MRTRTKRLHRYRLTYVTDWGDDPRTLDVSATNVALASEAFVKEHPDWALIDTERL